jgi:NTP pyrophosphatase (non-canonical NTP hydrolase)
VRDSEEREDERMGKDQLSILHEIRGERDRQDEMWGMGIVLRTSEFGYRVLGEEVGEVAKAINERRRAGVRLELTHVAAVAVAMIEALDHGSPLAAKENN